MRAKFINEFERGTDPRKTMDIGARVDAPVLTRIVFDAWDGGSQDGGFIKKHYLSDATHKYLQALVDGDFEGPGGVYKHPTRVRYYFKPPQASMDYKDLAGQPIRYEDELYLIPKELGDIEWKRRNV